MACNEFLGEVTINQDCCCKSGVIRNDQPQNPQEIVISSIDWYQAMDPLPNYVIEFWLKDSPPVNPIVWSFNTAAERDATLDKIRLIMGTVVV
jgi:hypothetical protein